MSVFVVVFIVSVCVCLLGGFLVCVFFVGGGWGAGVFFTVFSLGFCCFFGGKGVYK